MFTISLCFHLTFCQKSENVIIIAMAMNRDNPDTRFIEKNWRIPTAILFGVNNSCLEHALPVIRTIHEKQFKP